jgi:uroporphyrinogen decarboxylase
VTDPSPAAAPQNKPRIIRACRGERLDRPPVWLMRQAGRYMEEYRAVREKVSFLDLCKNPELAAEVSLQPYHAFGMDAVIMFSDILIPPEAMGMEVVFGDGGPTFPNPIRNVADIERLIIPDPHEKTGFVMDLLRRLSAELKDDSETGLVGFAGAPWTLAVYMVEGGGSRHFARIKGLMYEAPELLEKLLDKLAETVTLYLNAQIEAGAQVVQLFDTWAGILSPEEYRRFILPAHQKIIDGLQHDKAPVILYVNNSRGLLPLMAEAKPDVISVDSLTNLTEARQIIGPNIALQGNLDPILLLGDADVLDRQVQHLLQEGGSEGYIFNLGHGILPPTPPENVRLVVSRVKESAALFWNQGDSEKKETEQDGQKLQAQAPQPEQKPQQAPQSQVPQPEQKLQQVPQKQQTQTAQPKSEAEALRAQTIPQPAEQTEEVENSHSNASQAETMSRPVEPVEAVTPVGRA